MRKKIYYMKTKQHAIKKTNGSVMKSKNKFKITLRQMKMQTQPYKICGIQLKQFLEESS